MGLRQRDQEFLLFLMECMINVAVSGGYRKPTRKPGRKRGRVRVVSSVRLQESEVIKQLKHKVRKLPLYEGKRKEGRCACCHNDEHSKKHSQLYCIGCSPLGAGDRGNTAVPVYFCTHECAEYWHTHMNAKLRFCGQCRSCTAAGRTRPVPYE